MLTKIRNIDRTTLPLSRLSKIVPHMHGNKEKKCNRIFAVDICFKLGGFGANLEWCLEIMMHCERFKLTPYIQLPGRNYVSEHRGNDYFAYFFENAQLSTNDEMRIRKGEAPITRIRHIDDLGLRYHYNVPLTLDNAPKLIKKYLRIKDDITDEVDAFCKNHFGHNVLGIHYRGTDKRQAPRTDYSKVKRNLQYYLEKNPHTDCVFFVK
ncbi:MAG: hypothetical protein JRJ47_06600 [Deltaproteobacteria bacterium]|nr:hypothetical protein [Deltaproteobacteria bacterium]